MPLSPNRLIEGIKTGRRMGPFGVDDRQLEKLIAEIRTKHLELYENAPEVTLLRQALEASRFFLSPERQSLFDKYCIYVLPHPAFIAFAQRGGSDGPDAIVISQGTIDLIAASIHDAYVQSLIPDSVHDVVLENFRQDMGLLQLLANTLFLLRYRTYRYCEPLPGFSLCLDEKALRSCANGIQGALMFLLLHEIGHLELNHFDRFTARAMQYELVVDEYLSEYQKHEVEADQYTLDSLIPRAQPIVTYWMSQALSFFVSLELVSGFRDAHHPMALNRSFHSNRFRLNRWQIPDVEPNFTDYTHHAKRFLATEEVLSTGKNRLIDTPRETCMNVLAEGIELISRQGVDLSGLLKPETTNWLFTSHALSKTWDPE